MADESYSIGHLLDVCEGAAKRLVQTADRTTEPYERAIAADASMVATAVRDLIMVVREHLSCHDCDEEETQDAGD